MRSSEEISIDAWGLNLAGRFWPGTGRPIVALHGWLDNANSFAPLAQHLQAPMLALDFAGHGHSGHRPARAVMHYVDHVRDVIAAAEAMGWDSFDLLGHSMGAGVATLLAAAYPDRVRRVVLVEGLGPPTTPEAEVGEQLRKAIDDMHALADKIMPLYTDPEQAVAARERGFGGLSKACARLLCERGLRRDEDGWRWRTDPRLRLASSLRLSEAQVEGFVRAIQAPVMLVVGEQGMGGSGMFDHRVQWLRDVRVSRLEGRHHLHMECPQAVAPLISGFFGADQI